MPRTRSAQFDAAFFARYYGDPETRVADDGDAATLAALVAGAVHYTGVKVRSILDAGCGVGLLRAPLLAAFPGASYVGLEASEYLCAQHGWVQGSLADYAPRRRYDLVVCHDVLQYLDDRSAARSLARLAALCDGMLYFSALTKRDARQVADRARSDFDVHLRDGDWYRRRLRRGFRHLGFGVHLSRDYEPVEWELERPWR